MYYNVELSLLTSQEEITIFYCVNITLIAYDNKNFEQYNKYSG